MKIKNAIYVAAFAIITTILPGGCSEGDLDTPSETPNGIKIGIKADESTTKAPGGGLLPNRVLILPFSKVNEGLSDDAVNYIPAYNLSKQIDIGSFPVRNFLPYLQSGITYKILIIGYNRYDYTFNTGSLTNPVTLANFSLQPVKPTEVPEIFTCIANGYMGATLVGQAFKPEQVNYIEGDLNRIVSGLTLTINNIPLYIKSISLSAEKLVTAISAFNGTPLLWQTAGDNGIKLFGDHVPLGGVVTFNYFLLPIPQNRNSLFYLDVSYGAFKERYTLNVTGDATIIQQNRITFKPNHWVKIVGSYNNINLGFNLVHDINLDDDVWDGIQ